MTFPQAVNSAYLNYFNYKTRASRSEYWWFQLYTIIALIVLSFLGDNLITQFLGFIIIGLPSWSLTVRRLHDVGRSAWWFFAGYILGFVLGYFVAEVIGSDEIGQMILIGLCTIGVIIGFISFIFCFFKSAPDNQWGPKPV
ncbi:MAG: DUF805 domain-containing protein [Cardiobacteriaceae bacterium]|nr:DUF805 domain-containing protein [Cardiobacteriaceae bacterium]